MRFSKNTEASKYNGVIMKVILIGGVHNSLSCRDRLVSTLNDISESERSVSFVAVEYDENTFYNRILPLRDAIDECKKKNPIFSKYVSDDEMHELASCIGYDGDAHMDIFPDVETVWLDEGREPNENLFAHPCGSFLYNKIGHFVGMIMSGDIIGEYGERLFEYIALENDGAEEIINNVRDESWFEIISEFLTDEEHDCGIAIVGGSHAEEKEGNFRSLLENAGHNVEVIMTY